MSIRPLLVTVLALVVSGGANAQNDYDGRLRDLGHAAQLAGSGQASLARRLVDSLIAIAPPDSSEIPDLLFARASLAVRAEDADSDYQRIVAGFPASPRREESLLRLGQRALLDDDAQTALHYLQQVLREYRSDPSQARAKYWLARVPIEIPQPGANRPRIPVTMSPSPVKTPPASTPRAQGSYAVQVAAFATRAGAEQLAAKLRKAGLEARVDGRTQPFRVRVGSYATYAEAVKGRRDLKSRKISGFVTEINP